MPSASGHDLGGSAWQCPSHMTCDGAAASFVPRFWPSQEEARDLDAGQRELKARLASMSEREPEKFHGCLQEIQETLGWALSIPPRRCHKILHEGKTWEIRGTHCRKHLGKRVGIAQAGSGTLVGEATVKESKAITREDLEAARHLHQISDVTKIPYSRPHAWTLEDAVAYEQPVPYSHPAGCQVWIPLAGSKAKRSRKRAAVRRSWAELLEYRQSSSAPEEAPRHLHAERERLRRLVKKFPAVYGPKARSEKAWMTRRARAFRTWCTSSSWRMCNCCGRMVPQPYKSQHARGTARMENALSQCQFCRSDGTQGYWAPNKDDVPGKLRNLPPEVIEALRPFNIHKGPECRAPHGYEVHTDMLRFSFKTESVEEALARLPRKARKKGEKALVYLLKSDLSSYDALWQLHHRFLAKRKRQIRRGDIGPGAPVKRLPVNFIETVGLECSLWPHLYWRTDMTETHTRSMDVRRRKRRPRKDAWDSSGSEEMDGSGRGRQSAKASFLAKAHSCVIGYNGDPTLLQFVYDLWLFTTVGAARSSTSSSIREALASKPYSPELWRGYHAALVDLQRQIGWPQLFATIAPYEWSFPYHAWHDDELAKLLKARLHLPVAETIHIAHVLTQAVKGLLTDSNEGLRGKGQEHIFSSTGSYKGVRKWVARLEFQDGKRKRGEFRDPQAYHGRGTVHAHILLWLENMESMSLSEDIRADLPGESEPELRDLVRNSQLDWTSSGWPVREEPTKISEASGLLELRHPQDAHDQHCRAYLTDVLSALHCHTDVVASDGRAMILKYCASPSDACSRPDRIAVKHTVLPQGYLPKFSSSFAQELLNDQASGFALARRILADYHPLQPEMVMQLAAQQHPQFLCPAVVRKFVVPVPWKKEMPQDVRNYMDCSWRRRSMSLIEYLRVSGSGGQIAQRYRRLHKARKIGMPLIQWINTIAAEGEILVACIMYSSYSDLHFGQWLLLHVPFRDIADLWDDRVDCLPEELRFLGLCLLHRPDFWRSPRRIAGELELEARTDLYITNTLEVIRARTELIDAFLSGEVEVPIGPPHSEVARAAQAPRFEMLAPEQQLVARTIGERVDTALACKWPEDSNEASWWKCLDANSQSVGRRVTAILGPAGSGKSTAVQVAIRRAVEAGAHVGVACPTGLLASKYRVDNPDLDVDTIHGMFALYKDEVATLEMMNIYDLVVIDEIGQVPLWIFERILRLWDAADRRPALVLVGDFCQLTGPDGTTAQQSARWPEVGKVCLHTMRRCKCSQLRWKLQLLRSTTPSGRQLRQILKKHTACGSDNMPTGDNVASILRRTPRTQFVTISRRASARLNHLAIGALFDETQLLGYIPADPDENHRNFHGQSRMNAEPFRMPVFPGMRVTITKNEDKEHGFVNGMGGVVQRMRRSGLQVLLDNGKVVLVHSVTQDYELADGSVRRVTALPLRLGYSSTLHKIQGATLDHATIWLDVPFVRGAAYVAISRVRKDANWQFLGRIERKHCVPAGSD